MTNLLCKSWNPWNLFSFSGDSVCILFGLYHAESDADSFLVRPGGSGFGIFLLFLVVSVLELFSGPFSIFFFLIIIFFIFLII